jgi:ribonuclease Z
MMFDCGPAATYKIYASGFKATEVDHLFFTHHHSDHDADYPCFLLSRFDMSIGKENQLNVYGPTLTEQLTERVLGEEVGAYWHDIVARTNRPLSLEAYVHRGGTLPRRPPKINARDIEPGIVATGKTWEITAAPVDHVQPYLDSLAYRIDSDEDSIVFSGNTRPLPEPDRPRERSGPARYGMHQAAQRLERDCVSRF